MFADITLRGGAILYSRRVARYSKKETVSQFYEMLSNNLVEHRTQSLKKSSSKQEFFNILLTQQVANNIR
jgi:vacuolar-type H+-ATPase subunit E/Vma4